jgi:hypothetical protein
MKFPGMREKKSVKSKDLKHSGYLKISGKTNYPPCAAFDIRGWIITYSIGLRPALMYGF